MARIVIDSNVIVSAVFGGKPLDAVAIALRNHEIFISGSVEREFEGLLLKLSRKLKPEQLESLKVKFKQLFSRAGRVEIKSEIRLCRDPADNHYLALAHDCCADYLITGDKDLLEIDPELLRENRFKCRIVTPQWFVDSSRTEKI